MGEQDLGRCKKCGVWVLGISVCGYCGKGAKAKVLKRLAHILLTAALAVGFVVVYHPQKQMLHF
jgi:hypothetical protein